MLACGIVDELHFAHDAMAASYVALDQREPGAHPAGSDSPDGHIGKQELSATRRLEDPAAD